MSGSRARNVVLISLDTLRYDCVGVCPDKAHLAAYGVEGHLHTPNLDRFFQESAYFSQCLTPATNTTPAHASVMTALYPARHGARALFKWAVAEEAGTLAEELKGRGYRTVAVLEDGRKNWLSTGTEVLRGFDQLFQDERAACEYCASLQEPVLFFVHTWDIHVPYCWSYLQQVCAESTEGKEMVALICDRLGIDGPKGPTNSEQEEFWRRAGRKARQVLEQKEAAALFLCWYIQGVNFFDRVRWPRIVGALRQSGLYESAITAVFADHGEAMLPDGRHLLMWHTGHLLEDALRVPLALHAPGVPAGALAAPCSLVDVAPTVLDYLGFTPNRLGRAGETDGVPLLRSAAAPRRSPYYFAEAWDKNRQLSRPRAGGDEYVVPTRQERTEEVWTPWQACVRAGGLKLIWHPGFPDLRRFRPPRGPAPDRGGSSLTRLRRFLRRHLPRPLVRLVRWMLHKRRRAGARTAQNSGTGLCEWREAPLFVLDLKDDPLEEHPRLLELAKASPEEKELVERLKQYWESGILGPPIKLGPEEDEQILQRLRDLGYAD